MPATQASRTGHRLLAAFADPLRLRILSLLRGGELCVGDLVTLLGVPQPTASRHLARLRRDGLVRVTRRGLWAFYALAPAATRFHGRLIECLECCCDEVPELARDRQRAGRLRRQGGCCPLSAPCGPPRRGAGR